MKIHEYQAKALLREFGVPVPNGDVADTPANCKPRLMCMTRMNLFEPGEAISVAPIRTFPILKDLVTDVSYNYEKAKHIHITDNGIVPLKERMADNFDPVVWLLRKVRGGKKKTPA